jgi:putative flippase GtrA
LQFLTFCVVGVAGFVTDALTTLAATQLLGLDPLPGRAIAFLVAASITWYLNRRYTFRSTAGSRSLAPYLALTGFGALINIGVYRTWVQTAGAAPVQLVTGVALGSVTALAFNFLISRYVVFRVQVAENGRVDGPTD